MENLKKEVEQKESELQKLKAELAAAEYDAKLVETAKGLLEIVDNVESAASKRRMAMKCMLANFPKEDFAGYW